MSYERVRKSRDPQRSLLDFLDSVYRVAVTNGGLDAAAYRTRRTALRRGADP